MTLNVSFFSPGWPVNKCPNGIVTYVHNLITAFDNNDINSTVITFLSEKSDIQNRIINLGEIKRDESLQRKIYNKLIGMSTSNTLASLRYKTRFDEFSKIIAKGLQTKDKPDLIEIEESYGIPYFLKQQLSTPVLTRLHGPWFIHGPILKANSEQDFRFRLKYEGLAIACSEGVTAPCQDVLDQTRNFYNLELPHAKVIPNPVPIANPDEYWNYSTIKNKSILFVGRFDLHKGADIAIKAFRLLASSDSEVQLILVGPDRSIVENDVTYNCQDYINHVVKEKNIRDRITFLGQCDQEKITQLRSKSLVTLISARYENFPLSLLEALSMGCPVVATAVGGIKEIIRDQFNGLLATTESIEDIADKLSKLINDPDKMITISKNAIDDSIERYAPEVVARQSLIYYKSIVA